MRALLVIIDSFGIGALPDAALYGDEGANTALHICEGVETVKWPTLQKLGLGNAAELLGHTLPGCEAVRSPLASFAALMEHSQAKDTTTGHWELAGLTLEQPFTTFPLKFPSFPQELLARFTELTGYKVLGNKGISGTAIIEELGQSHLDGNGVIIYTSADSVIQIAAHDRIVPIEELYRICEITRTIADDYSIGRVIARPFTGEPGNFTRTSERKDFSMVPPADTILDHLHKRGIETVAVGKIGDIFSEQGINKSYHDHGNDACLERLLGCLKEASGEDQFFFVNLVDTDMLYGHRRDIQGYHDAVAKIDSKLPEIMEHMAKEDLLLITADHGCDPGFQGTDHTREHVPLLSYSKSRKPVSIGVRTSMTDVAASLASFFEVEEMPVGQPFI